MNSGVGICAVAGKYFSPLPRNLTLQFSNLVTAQKLRTNTLLTMYGFYLDKTTNEISLSRNFSRFSSQ